jgi:hypothetical protein
MSTLYGNQYQDAFVDVPSNKVKGKDIGGEVKKMYFDFTITAAPTAGDVIKVGVLPKGARIYNAGLQFPDLGTAGILNLGWAAGAEGLEAADADGLLVNVDVNTAADAVSMQIQMEAGGSNAGYMKELAEEVVVQIDVATAWTVSAGTIKGFVEFIY